MALHRVRDMQIVRGAVPQRARARARRDVPRGPRHPRHPGARRVAPPDQAGPRRAQGLLTLALHALRQVST